MLTKGDKAPEVLGTDENGRLLSLSDFAGEKIALYFYPKDMTAGCTAQACSLRDGYGALMAAGYRVVGVSADPAASHLRFKAKYELPFPLIADTDHTLAETFGVWGEKSMYGRKYMGMFRTTFIIDADTAEIMRVITPKEVKTKIHADQILAG